MHDYRTIKIANLLSYYYQKTSYLILRVYERFGINLVWSIKNSCEVLNKLKSRGFLMQSEIIIYDLVRKYVKLSPFSQTIFLLDLDLNYIDQL